MLDRGSPGPWGWSCARVKIERRQRAHDRRRRKPSVECSIVRESVTANPFPAARQGCHAFLLRSASHRSYAPAGGIQRGLSLARRECAHSPSRRRTSACCLDGPTRLWDVHPSRLECIECGRTRTPSRPAHQWQDAAPPRLCQPTSLCPSCPRETSA